MAAGYIELIGPPGAGKSTIGKRLLAESSTLYGGYSPTPEMMARRLGWPKLLSLPSSIAEPAANQYWVRSVRHECLYRFVSSHPNALTAFATAIENAPRDTPEVSSGLREWLGFALCETAAIFQLLTDTAAEDETIVQDNSFCQLGVAAMARSETDVESMGGYFIRNPQPEILLHVDAPTETCLQRQYDRKHSVPPPIRDSPRKEALAHVDLQRSLCREVCSRMRETGTTVLDVETTSPIEDTVNVLQRDLAEHVVVD